jgi:hypothetical protein
MAERNTMPRNASLLAKIAGGGRNEETKARPLYQHQHSQLTLGNKSISYLAGIKKAHIFPFM